MKIATSGQTTAPRDAATVVVLRDRPDVEPEFFMVRRASTTAFMPDTWVFPGGRVDHADRRRQGDLTFVTAACRECREEADIELSPAQLQWFDTWRTPSAEARRYTARFYSARIPERAAERAHADGYEATAGRWGTASDFLDAWRHGDVDLPPPTLCTIMLISKHGVAALTAREPTELTVPILPKVTTVNDESVTVLPHDPEYASLPGEAVDAPTRASAMPARLVRRLNRWMPCE